MQTQMSNNKGTLHVHMSCYCNDIGVWDAEPDVLSIDAVPAFKWGEPDEEALVEFLVVEKNFNEDRVRVAIKKVHGTKGKSSQGLS